MWISSTSQSISWWKQLSSLLWVHSVTTQKKKSFILIALFFKKCMIMKHMGNEIKMRYIGKNVKSAGWRIAILADKIICNHHRCPSARRLHWSSDFSERGSSNIRKARNTKANRLRVIGEHSGSNNSGRSSLFSKMTKHLETACYMGKPTRSVTRYETRHGSGPTIQEIAASRFRSGRWYSSRWTGSYDRCVLKQRSEYSRNRTSKNWFEKTWRRRRWCAAKNPSVPHSKRAKPISTIGCKCGPNLWQGIYFNLGQMAEWWDLQPISVCPQFVGCLGSIFGSHCTTLYLPQCHATAKRKKYAHTLIHAVLTKADRHHLHRRDQGSGKR